MEFEGQYLTYEEYKELGGTLDLTPFNILEFEARRKIDVRTQNRLKNVDTIPKEVKMCVYDMIDNIKEYTENNISGNIASESIDGYSVSYVNPTQLKDVVKSRNSELDDIMETWLVGVICNGKHIAYLGVD